MDLHSFQYKRILVINLGGIGDVLLSTPALRTLKNTYPFAEISMLVVPRVVPLAERLPYITRVYSFQKTGFDLFDAVQNIPNLMLLRNGKFHLAINMRRISSLESSRKLQMILNIIRPAQTAGRNTEARGGFFTISIPEEDLTKTSEMDHDLALVEQLGVKISDRAIDFPLRSEDNTAVERIMKRYDRELHTPIIVVQPGGKPGKRWMKDRFSQLINRLRTSTDAFYVITGSKEERGLAAHIASSAGTDAANLAGKLTIFQTGALLKKAKLFITNDNGMMHVAAGLQVPMVAMLTPGSISRYDPRIVDPKALVLWKEPPCAPCIRDDCTDPACLQDISVEEALEACLTFL